MRDGFECPVFAEVNGIMKYAIGSLQAIVNVEKTADLYKLLNRYGWDSAASFNFAKALKEIEPAAVGYFGTLGIDPFAFQDLFVESVDAKERMIEYSGYYPIVTENETELLSALNMRNDQEDLYEAIITDFGFDISFAIWDGHVSLFFSNSMPWLLTPDLIKGKYENRNRVPEIDIRGLPL